mmetsp:Transcript_62639/g.186357  ORF Transcript_62639/g.186357 Transcript_62639/m.186357 type:complete len:206 (-) Transcript_62639:301-918(-)
MSLRHRHGHGRTKNILQVFAAHGHGPVRAAHASLCHRRRHAHRRACPLSRTLALANTTVSRSRSRIHHTLSRSLARRIGRSASPHARVGRELIDGTLVEVRVPHLLLDGSVEDAALHGSTEGDGLLRIEQRRRAQACHPLDEAADMRHARGASDEEHLGDGHVVKLDPSRHAVEVGAARHAPPPPCDLLAPLLHARRRVGDLALG